MWLSPGVPNRKSEPPSEGRLRAQQQQLEKQAADMRPPAEDDGFCIHCNYAMVTQGDMRFCSKCFRQAGE